MVTLHLLLPLEQAPNFVHVLQSVEGCVFQCVTVRGGMTQCACGRYQLCDPLAGACRAGCDCQCHLGEEVCHER